MVNAQNPGAPGPGITSDAVFHVVQEVVGDFLGIPPSQITRDTPAPEFQGGVSGQAFLNQLAQKIEAELIRPLPALDANAILGASTCGAISDIVFANIQGQ